MNQYRAWIVSATTNHDTNEIVVKTNRYTLIKNVSFGRLIDYLCCWLTAGMNLHWEATNELNWITTHIERAHVGARMHTHSFTHMLQTCWTCYTTVPHVRHICYTLYRHTSYITHLLYTDTYTWNIQNTCNRHATGGTHTHTSIIQRSVFF